jgi:hypothetical protein
MVVHGPARQEGRATTARGPISARSRRGAVRARRGSRLTDVRFVVSRPPPPPPGTPTILSARVYRDAGEGCAACSISSRTSGLGRHWRSALCDHSAGCCCLELARCAGAVGSSFDEAALSYLGRHSRSGIVDALRVAGRSSDVCVTCSVRRNDKSRRVVGEARLGLWHAVLGRGHGPSGTTRCIEEAASAKQRQLRSLSSHRASVLLDASHQRRSSRLRSSIDRSFSRYCSVKSPRSDIKYARSWLETACRT